MLGGKQSPVCGHVRQFWTGLRLPCASVGCVNSVGGRVLVFETTETTDHGTRWEFARHFVDGQFWEWSYPTSSPVDFGRRRAEVHARTMKYIARNL